MVQGVIIENGILIDTDPASGEEISRVPVTSPAELENVIHAAKDAQAAWSAKPLKERADLLKAAISSLAPEKKELSKIIVREMGKVLSEAVEEVDEVLDKVDFINLVVQANAPVELAGGRCTVIRQPHGVVAICSPWNYPANEILLLAIPALAAGNSVVVKPSEVAPLTGAKIVAALQRTLPLGVVGLVQGDGSVGAPLVEHPDIAMAAMTGSSATGKQIMESCSRSLKRLVLELGGKDPMVVFADADLDLAADDAVAFSVANCGQVCCAVERIYVEDSIKTDFEKKVVEKATEYVVGNGFNEGSKVGPLVSHMQKDIVTRQVDDAVANGAKILYKSKIPTEGGSYYPVTVLTDLKQTMTIQQEETFGPVVAIASFSGTEKDAIELANDTSYGLSACVYSQDIAKATRVSSSIRAGQVGVNNYPMLHADLKCPWVGHKGSGFGYHSGPDGWRQFSAPQSIVKAPRSPARYP